MAANGIPGYLLIVDAIDKSWSIPVDYQPCAYVLLLLPF
jgi:hypothetical protein